MSAQPSRPWFRLATMVRPPPPPTPAPTAQPNQGPSPSRPAFARPAFTTTAVPPPQQPTQTPPPQQPNPTPSPPRSTPPMVPTTNVVGPSAPPRPTPPPVPTTNVVEPPASPLARQSRDSVPSPPSSPPKIIRLAEQTSPPLSPLALPSALKQKSYNHESPPEYKQKTMIVQETKENPKNISSNGRPMTTRKPETHKKQVEDVGMKNTITIAGDNKGAIMNITPFSKTPESSNIINRSNNGESTDGKNNKNSNRALLKTSFLNSNVQGVNNSMVFNCTIGHHDPGIHLTFSTKSDHGHAAFNSKEG